MTWFTEDPSPFLYLAIAVQVILLVMLMQTRRVAVIGIMGVVLALLGGVYLIDFLVTTEREKVTTVVVELVEAAEEGDKDRLLSHIADDATLLRSLASDLMKQAKIEQADVIAGPKVTINELTAPPSASAQFKVFARGRYYSVTAQRVVEIVLDFRRVDGVWKATKTDYKSPFQ